MSNHENTRGWVAIWIMAFAMSLSVGLCVKVQAQDSATLTWAAPTHRVGSVFEDKCEVQGAKLTEAELATLEYTLSYRVKGTTAWTNVDTVVPQVTLEGLAYNTTYEASVGARFPGGTIVCASDLLEWTMGAGPAPGSCTSLRKLP